MPFICVKRNVFVAEVLAPYSCRVKLLSQLLSHRPRRLEPLDLTPFHWVVLCCLWEEIGLATSSIGEKRSR